MDKQNQQAVRDVTRRLQSAVRSDWHFPAPPGASTAAEPQNYRERYYGTTDDSDSDHGRAHAIDDLYAFDNPDSVGDEVDQRLQERKRKRRKALEEDMAENPGLLFYAHRRNAWTGAVVNNKPRERPRPDSEIFSTTLNTDPQTTHAPVSEPASPHPMNVDPADSSGTAPSRDLRLPNTPLEDLTDVIIPVATPLIPPTHPVRVTISSRSPSELYDKVVRDQRTPAVPINLSDMIPIIVQGWKDEGNWPPKAPLAPDPLPGRKKAPKNNGLKGGEGESKHDSEGLLANHPHLKSGMDTMKKVFRLSGSPGSARRTHSRPQSQSFDQNNV